MKRLVGVVVYDRRILFVVDCHVHSRHASRGVRVFPGHHRHAAVDDGALYDRLELRGKPLWKPFIWQLYKFQSYN